MTAAELLELFHARLVEEATAGVLAELGPLSPPEPDRLLTAQDVAEYLGRSPRWVRERRARGDLAYIRLDGGAAMYRMEDVLAFVAARRVGR